MIKILTGFVGADQAAATLWTFATAMSTLLLVFVGYWQFKKLNKTSSAEFIHKFSQDFFSIETRYLILLIDNDWIEFESDNRKVPIFKINKKDAELKQMISEIGIDRKFAERTYYTSYEIDDFVLGPFEDCANLEKKGILEIGMIYESNGLVFRHSVEKQCNRKIHRMVSF